MKIINTNTTGTRDKNQQKQDNTRTVFLHKAVIFNQLMYAEVEYHIFHTHPPSQTLPAPNTIPI